MSGQIQDLHEDLQSNYTPEKTYVHPWYKIKKEMIESVQPSGLNGVWLSLVERPLWEREVVGSNPITPIYVL